MQVRRFAMVTLALTFLLLLAGGLVSGTHSGLACPDWPTCYGSYFPPYEGGIEFEHTHRVIALLVGLCTVILAAGFSRTSGASRRATAGWVALFLLPLGLRGAFTRMSPELGRIYVLACIAVFTVLAVVLLARALARRSLPLAGLGAAALVVVQGFLGGLTVLFELPPAVSIVHLSTAMAFFSLLVAIVIGTRAPGQRTELSPWVGLGALAVYAQVVLGAVTRHLDGGLACGAEMPLCRGSLWPAGAHPVVLVHAAHRLNALLVAAVVIAVAVHVYRRAGSDRRLRMLALAGPALVVAQIILGVLSVLSWLDLATVTAHLGVGALLLADMVAILVLSRPSTRVAGATLAPDDRTVLPLGEQAMP